MKHTKLQSAVLDQLGGSVHCIDINHSEYDPELIGRLEDIVNHGIDGGFNGFIYYAETVKFFDENRTLILQSLVELSDDLGESVIDIVKGFNCLRVSGSNSWVSEINSVLLNLPCTEGDYIKNALAWYAAETVARELIDDYEAEKEAIDRRADMENNAN